MHRNYVYSQHLQAFLQQLSVRIKKIINEETPWKYRTSRIHIDNITYPLQVVLFEGPGRIGFCQPTDYVIGLHKDLSLSPSNFVDNVLRHELAHYFAGIFYPQQAAPHGEDFQRICRQLHWQLPEIAKARVQEVPISPKLEKINKLLALATSSNPHEAQLATLRAQQLLAQFQLDFLGPAQKGDSEDPIFHMRRVLTFRKKTGKIRAICAILQEFFVYPVTNHCRSGNYLEITGRPENVEIASYVVAFLNRTLENLWQLEQQSNPQLRGVQRKNSFMAGIAAGYLGKIKSTPLSIAVGNQIDSRAIIKVKEELQQAVDLVYRSGLTSSRNAQKVNLEAQQLGIAAGKQLQIQRALNSTHVSAGEIPLLPERI